MQYRGFTLDRFQAEAITHIQEGRSVLVSAPTGTGKTIIADYVVEKALEEGVEVVYTAPIKALSNQKYRDYTRLYGKDPIGLVTGDLVINKDAPVRIMTTEILRNILLQQGPPPRLKYVIIDEIHFLDDPERGTVWEELLIYLPEEVKIIGLSATLPNIDEFASWLTSVRGKTVEVVKEDERAVPLKIMTANRLSGLEEVKDFERSFRRFVRESEKKGKRAPERGRDRAGGRGRGGRRGSRGRGKYNEPRTLHLDMVRMLDPDYLPILYFVFSRRQTESFARDLGRRVNGSFLSKEAYLEVEATLRGFDNTEPGVLTDEHRNLYLNGIAFHHAGLHVGLKALVEDLYERRLVQVLYCTSTFAMGLNMPARTVVFESIRKFDGQEMKPLSVRQFMQKAGRAGRRGLDEVGFVVLRTPYEDFEEWKPHIERFMGGGHERINSAFSLSFSSIANLLVRLSEKEIRDILDKSFLNFRNRAYIKKEARQLGKLEGELVVKEDEGISRFDKKKLEKLIRRKKRLLVGAEGRLYQDLSVKIRFLEKIGYINADGSFNAGGQALRHIQIEEIFMTELMLSGLFEDVNEDELFGIFTGMVMDVPRSMVIQGRLTPRWLELADRIKTIREGKVVMRAEEIQVLSVHFSPTLMPFGELWAQGESLNALLLRIRSETDIAGDLVGAFRRAKDLASQLRVAFKGYDMMTERLTKIMRKVSRDEVEVLD